MPAGTYGPAFLTPKNYFALKDYNFSDLYVLFVGHLADRIAGARAVRDSRGARSRSFPPRRSSACSASSPRRGLYGDKIDGKAGMLTRAALGAYQKANGLKLDCWPTQAVLDHMQQKMKTRRRFRVRRAGISAQVGRSVSRAEEARAAPADHVAVRIAHRTARPVAAGAAIGRSRAVAGYGS